MNRVVTHPARWTRRLMVYHTLMKKCFAERYIVFGGTWSNHLLPGGLYKKKRSCHFYFYKNDAQPLLYAGGPVPTVVKWVSVIIIV